MEVIIGVALTIVCLPILTYWLAYFLIEMIREDDGTLWTKNPLKVW